MDAAQAKATGDFSKAEATFRKNAEGWIRTIMSLDKKKGRPVAMPPSKQSLINGVMANFGRVLLNYGMTREQVVLWAAQVVNGFPSRYWDPKTYGKTKAGTKAGTAPSIESQLGGG